MKTFNRKITLQTKELFDFNDITDQVKEIVEESGIKDGLVNIQILHTSAGIIVNENEPLLIEDFKDNLEMIAPRSKKYRHDNFDIRTVNICEDECMNGHSHCKAIHLLMNVTLNLIKDEIQLGQWQRVFLVELDSSRKRSVQVQILGV